MAYTSDFPPELWTSRIWKYRHQRWIFLTGISGAAYLLILMIAYIEWSPTRTCGGLHFVKVPRPSIPPFLLAKMPLSMRDVNCPTVSLYVISAVSIPDRKGISDTILQRARVAEQCHLCRLRVASGCVLPEWAFSRPFANIVVLTTPHKLALARTYIKLIRFLLLQGVDPRIVPDIIYNPALYLLSRNCEQPDR